MCVFHLINTHYLNFRKDDVLAWHHGNMTTSWQYDIRPELVIWVLLPNNVIRLEAPSCLRGGWLVFRSSQKQYLVWMIWWQLVIRNCLLLLRNPTLITARKHQWFVKRRDSGTLATISLRPNVRAFQTRVSHTASEMFPQHSVWILKWFLPETHFLGVPHLSFLRVATEENIENQFKREACGLQARLPCFM